MNQAGRFGTDLKVDLEQPVFSGDPEHQTCKHKEVPQVQQPLPDHIRIIDQNGERIDQRREPGGQQHRGANRPDRGSNARTIPTGRRLVGRFKPSKNPSPLGERKRRQQEKKEVGKEMR